MATPLRSAPLILSIVLAVAMVSAAFLFSDKNITTTRVGAESTDEILQAYAAKDTDQDGLLDWEEVLYNTDPNNANSVSKTLTDGEAVAKGQVKPAFESTKPPEPSKTDAEEALSDIPGVTPAPGTITAKFAQQFFEQYVKTRGATPPTPEQATAYVTGALTALGKSEAITPVFNGSHIKTQGTGPEALKKYLVNAEHALVKSDSSVGGNPLNYLSDVIKKSDAKAVSNLSKLGKEYAGTAQTLIAIGVPAEATEAHLRIANALARMGVVIANMASYPTDPLRGVLGLSQYQATTLELTIAFGQMGILLEKSGVSVEAGEAGYVFYYPSMAAAGVVKKMEEGSQP